MKYMVPLLFLNLTLGGWLLIASIIQSTKTLPMAGADLRTVKVNMSPVTMNE